MDLSTAKYIMDYIYFNHANITSFRYYKKVSANEHLETIIFLLTFLVWNSVKLVYWTHRKFAHTRNIDIKKLIEWQGIFCSCKNEYCSFEFNQFFFARRSMSSCMQWTKNWRLSKSTPNVSKLSLVIFARSVMDHFNY